ncbi:MAG: sugar phosphate isomerase/epimerase [Clostridia bacterium]|nr:sugar phosphate isomerase/epimerase [Clostridia bacterium]
MKLATTTGDFFEYTYLQDDAIKYIKKAGFKYIDYSFGFDYRNNSGIFGEDFYKYIDYINRFANEQEIKFIQAHSPMGTPIVKNNNYRPFIDATNKCIEACGALGIKNIVVHSGYEGGLTKEQTFERNKEFYYELLPTAEKYGVNILTENFNKMCIPNLFWIDNAQNMRELIDFVDHPLFHCCWDTGHANMQEMPQHEELKILGNDVCALHVQDNFGNNDNHIAPFFGTMNIDSLMHGLADIGYDGYFTFESDCIFCPSYNKRTFKKDSKLLLPPIEIKEKAESMLYDIGKHILTSYDCFEE